MADDLHRLLEQFKREIASHVDSGIGSLRQQISELREDVGASRRESISHFDSVYVRFDRLETEYQAIAAAVARLETRSMTRGEFDRELEHLKVRIQQLEQRLSELEKSSGQN